MGLADPLNHQLGDPVAPADGERLVDVGVEQVDQDLAAVARVNRAGCVDHGNPVIGGQPRARVYERGIPRGQGDSHTSGNQSALTRSEAHVRAGVQVRSRVAGVGVVGQRQARVESRDQHLDLRSVSHLCNRSSVMPFIPEPFIREALKPLSRHPQGHFDSAGALATDRLATDFLGQLAAVMYEETARAGELIGLLGNHSNGQLLAGQVCSGKLEALGLFGLVDVNARLALVDAP
jgi:hypothetical protein